MEKKFLVKGVCDCKIVLPKDAHIVEKTAAEELSKYIEKALSIKLPIVCECKAEGKCIYVGMTEFAEKNHVLGKSQENWIMKMVSGSLVLTGGEKKGDRGVIYSVYHFLEENVGVRWWNPYEEDILELDSLSLSDDFYKEGTPAFYYRKPHMEPQQGADAFHFMAKTRTNVISSFDDNIPDGVYDENVKKFGGARTAGRPHHVHTMGKYFPADKYYDKHPEWWAWNEVRGERIRTGSYCFTNESFFKTLVEKVTAYIEEDIERSKREGVELPCFYSLSIDDINADFFCQCPECAKIRAESGDTGYALRFVNSVAREIKKVYPFVKIEILIYSNFVNPPKDDTLPEDNMIIRLADIGSDMLRGPHAKTNKRALALIERWADICKRAGCDFYVYDYIHIIRYNYPLPIFYRLKDMVNTYYDNGVKGIFAETNNSFIDSIELNKYLFTHLLEDPKTDVDALIVDFTDRYFGKAGAYIRKYYELLREVTERNCMDVLCCGEDSRFNYIDSTFAIAAEPIFEKAREAVKGEVVFERRVNWLAKALYGTMIYNFFDLKRQAKNRGENFDFDIKELKKRVITALEDYLKTPKGIAEAPNDKRFILYRVAPNCELESEYFENCPEEEEIFDIPEELRSEKEEDIFQFTLLNMPKYIHAYMKEVEGYFEVHDEDSSLSKVLKLSYDNGTGIHIPIMRVPTSKNAEKKKALYFALRQDGETIKETELYLEDIAYKGYHLYKLGSFENLSDSFHARVSLAAGSASINIKALSLTFPMDKCDVYLSMKASGEVYGGDKADENAIYFERMIIVRK